MNAERAVKRAPSPCACVSIAEQSEDVLRVTHGNLRLLRNVSLRDDSCSRAKVSGVPSGDLPCVEAVACYIRQRLTARISGKAVYGTSLPLTETAWVQLKDRRSWKGPYSRLGSNTVQDHPSRLNKARSKIPSRSEPHQLQSLNGHPDDLMCIRHGGSWKASGRHTDKSGRSCRPNHGKTIPSAE
jgi:hypothetical protein